MSDKTTYYQRNRETILNTAKEYYENNKDSITIQARNKYKELSDEEEEIRNKYGKNRYLNIPEENKQRLREYHNNYRNKKINRKMDSMLTKNQLALIK